jgi:hypothetical protein
MEEQLYVMIPAEQNNQRILTTEQLAEFYGTDENHIHDNYRKNKDRYLDGKHFYRLEGETLQEFTRLHPAIFRSQNASKFRVLYLWTEKGALQHAKSLSTDQAWAAYEKLVDEYYRLKDNPLVKVDAAIEHIDRGINHLQAEMRDILTLRRQLLISAHNAHKEWTSDQENEEIIKIIHRLNERGISPTASNVSNFFKRLPLAEIRERLSLLKEQ